jgi:hypothetical protein
MDGSASIDYIINNNIEGVLVECGVDDGHFQEIWIKHLQKLNHSRDIFLYDTFSGLTQPGEFDYTASTASIFKMNKDEVYNYWKKETLNGGWCSTPLNAVQVRLGKLNYPSDKLHYIVGDVMETLKVKENIPDKIALLRLDTDWYESSKIELELLYDRVVQGGLVIFDDYYHWDGQRRAVDEFFKSRNLQYTINKIGNGKTGAIIKT